MSNLKGGENESHLTWTRTGMVLVSFGISGLDLDRDLDPTRQELFDIQPYHIGGCFFVV